MNLNQAYAPNLSGRHGGGYVPSTGAFAQVPISQQRYPVSHSSFSHLIADVTNFVLKNRPHGGAGKYDPNQSNPPVVVHCQPIAHPQPTFSSQVHIFPSLATLF
jgi:hypothetical protein